MSLGLGEVSKTLRFAGPCFYFSAKASGVQYGGSDDACLCTGVDDDNLK